MNRSKGVNRLVLVMIALSVLSPYPLAFIFRGQDLTLYQSLAISQVIYLVPVLIYVLCTKGQVLNELQLKPIRISTMLMVILFAVLMMPVMSWLNLFTMLFTQNQIASSLVQAQETPLWLNLLYVAVLPALSEEFMFRGIFFHSYRPAGILKAAVVSGLCFGMLHLNINQFCYAFVLGTAFALLVESTGSMFSSMLAHTVINSSSVLMLAAIKLLPEEAAGQMDLSSAVDSISRNEIRMLFGFYSVLALVCGTLAVLVLIWIAKHCGRSEHMRAVLRRQDGGKGGCVTFCLVATILLAFGYMAVNEFILIH